MSDITMLYRIHFPEKEYIKTYDLSELERLASQFLTGHKVEKILAKFDHFHCSDSLADVDEEMIDADSWLGFEIFLALDHGVLELAPWNGDTIRLRFFSKDEFRMEEVPDGMNRDKDHTYYETRGPVTEMILQKTIDEISVVDPSPTALLIRLRNAGSVYFISDAAEEGYFEVEEK